MSEVVQQVINALAIGSIYALIALGVALIFSILRLINFAHGELLTISGYTMFFLQGFGAPLIVALTGGVAMAVVGALALERLAYRRLRDAQPLTLLLTSFAVSLGLQHLFILLFGARPKPIEIPDWVTASVTIGKIRLQWLDLATMLVSLVIMIALSMFLKRTIAGLALRAAAEDFPTTRLMGLRANGVIVGAFAVSGLLGGLAALFFFAATPIVAPRSGFEPMLMGFVATVLGGLGSLWGAVFGAYLLAALKVGVQSMLVGTFDVYVDALVFGAAILVLRFRPAGIFARTRVEEVRA